jgi:hypothetical protein
LYRVEETGNPIAATASANSAGIKRRPGLSAWRGFLTDWSLRHPKYDIAFTSCVWRGPRSLGQGFRLKLPSGLKSLPAAVPTMNPLVGNYCRRSVRPSLD